MVVVERLAVKNMTRSLARRGRWRVTRGREVRSRDRQGMSISIERWGLYIQIWVYIRFMGAITALRFGKTRARYE
ncbi:hypothetical protein BD309DRAFT_657081 [Dichomitus squalens]|nr:hypothetical protein BD309DRAFT_657081 [Dichomitus squalens]